MVPQRKKFIPEPDKNNDNVKICEICRLGSEQCHKKWKIAKNSRKGTEEPVERVRTRYNEKIKQR
jgi:hypothetical protein